MHKQFLTLLSVSLCIGFTSCSDDDDNQGGDNSYRSDAIVESILVNGRTYYQFSYDESGNISEINKGNGSSYSLTFNGNQLSIDDTDDGTAICTLSGGRVSKIDYSDVYGYICTLKYAGSHLSQGDFYTLTWDGNKIVKITENEQGYYEENTYEYSDIDNNANIDFNIIVSARMDDLVDDEYGWIPSTIGLTGTRTDKLISKEICYSKETGYGEDTIEYTYDYDIDSQHRVIKITKFRDSELYDTYEIVYCNQ